MPAVTPAGPPSAVISARILSVEAARRVGPGYPSGAGRHTGRPEPPEGLPPLAIVAERCFPLWVSLRIDRFEEAIGSRRGSRPLRTLDAAARAGATPEELIAGVRAAGSVETTDPYLAALAWSLGVQCRGPIPAPGSTALVDSWLDDALGPLSGPSASGPRADLPPEWGRLEAATVGGDRFFGRRAPPPTWEAAAAAVGRLGQIKRRIRP